MPIRTADEISKTDNRPNLTKWDLWEVPEYLQVMVVNEDLAVRKIKWIPLGVFRLVFVNQSLV